jgi:hypothetical protein
VGNEKKSWKVWVRNLAFAVVFVLVFAGLFFSPFFRAKDRAKNEPGPLHRALLVAAAEGAHHLVLVGNVGSHTKHLRFNYWRMDLVDLKSGKRIKRAVLDLDKEYGKGRGQPSFAPAGAGKFWIRFSRPAEHLELWNAEDLSPAANFDAISDAVPPLKNGIHGQVLYDPQTQHVVVTAKSGDGYSISPELKENHVSSDISRRVRAIDHNPIASSRLDASAGDFRFATLDGSKKRVLALGQERFPEASAVLEPEFIVDHGLSRPRAMHLADESGFIIEHASQLGQNGEAPLISGMDEKGVVQWTFKAKAGKVRASVAAGDLFILVLSTKEKGQAVAGDRKRGTVRWTYDLGEKE